MMNAPGQPPKPSGWTLNTYLHLGIGLVFAVAALLVILIVNYQMRQHALEEASAKADLLLERHLAIHTYFAHDLKPRLFETFSAAGVEADFDPVWMSSTFAIRQIDHYFQSLSKEDYYYKECAINARSPENEADADERAFIDQLQADPALPNRTEIRLLNGRPYFVYLRRGEVLEEGCLRCHSTPDQAPRGLVQQYGAERSFHRQVGEVISAISMRIPLATAYGRVETLNWELSGMLVALLCGLFALQFLLTRRLVFSPLGRIREKAQQISTLEEHLGEEIPVPAGRELRELATAFNAMSVVLRDSRDRLEERVRERTAALEQAYQQLAQRHASLEREIEQRRQAEEALRREHRIRDAENAVRVAIASMDARQALSAVVETISVHLEQLGLDHDAISIQILNAAGTDWTCVGRNLREKSFTWDELKDGVRPRPVPYGELFPWVIEAWRTGEPQYQPCYQGDSLPLRGRSILDVPFSQGTLAINHRQPQAFTAADIALLQRFAPLLSAAYQRYQDQAAREQAETALQEREERFRQLAENIQVVFWLGSPDWREVFYVSPAFEQVWGIPCHQLHADPQAWLASVVAEDREPVVADIRRRQDGDFADPRFPEYRIRRPDGGLRWIQARAFPIRDQAGKVYRIAGIAEDITEHKQLEQALLKAERLRVAAELSAGVCHNLNNILTGISAPALMLKRTIRDPESLQDLETIISSARRAADLVHQLHVSVRGQTRENPYAVDLDETVAQTLELTRPHWQGRSAARGTAIELRATWGDVPPIRGTESGVQEMIANLVFNAVEAMPAGGRIAIRTQAEGDFVRLSFSDTGVGMAEEVRRRVFEPFFTTKAEVGSGLGLSTLHGTLTQWGGRVEVESTPGQGTTFALYFPVWRD